MITDFAQVTTQLSVSNRSRKPCSSQLICRCQTTREESIHDRVVEDIKHDDQWCKGRRRYVWRGQVNVEYNVMDERRDPRLEEV